MKRTYSEYVEGRWFGKCAPCASFSEGRWEPKSYYSSGNGDSHVTEENNKIRESLGQYLNEVPTLESFKELVEVVMKWERDFDNKYPTGWNNSERGYCLRSLLHTFLGDKGCEIDEDIFRFIMSRPDVLRMNIIMVEHPSCPEDIIDDLIETPKKDDPTRHTRGGEIHVFMVYRPNILPRQIDRIVKLTKKCGTQNDLILHENISDETLNYLAQSGRSDTVKKNAFLVLFNRLLNKKV